VNISRRGKYLFQRRGGNIFLLYDVFSPRSKYPLLSLSVAWFPLYRYWYFCKTLENFSAKLGEQGALSLPGDIDEGVQQVGKLVITPQAGQAEQDLVPG
jgi:hypothetical protein